MNKLSLLAIACGVSLAASAKKHAPALTTAAAMGMFAVGNAHAVFAVDTAEATANIVIAGVAVTGVIAALTTFQVGKWAVMQVKKLFGR
ncbi:MAG: hypothetical protein Q7U63_13685 [Polaromonas sp.]|uniref:hypothetical protein n=1 Tax=Polaromonas sp. TaxID=1869339 RepID=UPI0027293CEA|nr:hypothetical protein [Polaromonas sp.]MDO9114828.1 hypothetical protein [Polaromonas sp.]